MLVTGAMQTHVVTLLEDDEVPHAARLLLHHSIASAPVLDAEGHLVGMVSESDLLRERLPQDPRAHFRADTDPLDTPPRTVADVMTPRPLTVDEHADLEEATRRLLDHGVKALPVVHGRRVVGILARRDVLRTLARTDDDVAADVRRRLEEDLPEDDWRVEVVDGVVTLGGPDSPAQRRIAAVLVRSVAGVVRVVDGDDLVSIDEPVHRVRP
ncbi:CBS domain-containing protein [Kineococcus gynurae]|uniref:CBS domain-containing protein n=1 Tax=Kineococcus gynurae TaxID=452979 RepID=A0ABV5LX96_9ACTN